jgi:tetraacyldisaccharide 4'-kinase
MGVFSPDWARMHQGEGLRVWDPFLFPFSMIYGFAVRLRLRAYEKGILYRRGLPGFVISVGNLTAGGTGKTPAVVMLGRWAQEEGHRVAILSRGYGGRYKAEVLVVSDGSRIKADPREAGDEPYLLAQKLPGIPVLVSRRRYSAGRFAREKFGSNFFVLDDGFQHLQLRRDLNLVLLSAAHPFGNGHLLPWGPLREPISQLERADAFILTGARDPSSEGATRTFLNEKFSKTPVYRADHQTEAVVFPHSKEVQAPGFLKEKRAVAFAGIARPEAFRNTLVKLGVDLVYFKTFKDHYQFESEDLRALDHHREKRGAHYLVTTEKDWVRMAPWMSSFPHLAYLSIKFVLLSNQGDFFRMIRDCITEKNK